MADRQGHDRDERRWSTWMAAANGGDKTAYKQLLTELAGVIEAYVRYRFGNLHLLEDCVQEAMIDGARMLDRVEPDHRDAVALTQYAGYSVPEAAQRLGVSESALKARLRRGLLAIRKRLEAEEIPL
ncbi:MAG: DNA-directed RNA polymerase specialized sigma24 family protein [Gammaproteobacteria bacterium]|jgi:DNA-directed RNA polymerase specialized sigma24 family protein